MKDFFWKIIRPNSSFVGPEGSLSSGVNNARVRQFFGFWFVMQPHNKNKATHTQLTTPLQQRRIQVVRSNKVARKHLTESFPQSRNGPRTYEWGLEMVLFLFFVWWLLSRSSHSHTQIYKQTMDKTKHTWTMKDLFWIVIYVMLHVEVSFFMWTCGLYQKIFGQRTFNLFESRVFIENW